MPPRNKTRLVELAKWALPILLSAFVAYSTAQFRAGAQEASTTLKIDSLEQKFNALDRSVVPRAEHEAHWKAVEDLLHEQQQDLREVRATQKEILLRLSQK